MLELQLPTKIESTKTLLVFLMLLCYSITFQAQFKDSRVSLIEDKRDKRTLLYLQNNTDQTLNVFLKVDGEGYRKSSDRPVIKDIPAKGKVLMITLIPLKDEPSSYTHFIVVNEAAENIEVNHRPDDPKLKDFELLLDNDLVIFVKNSCQPCDKLIEKLQAAHVPHKVINIDKRRRYFTALNVLMNRENSDSNIITMPVVRRHEQIIHPITSINKTAKVLIEEFAPLNKNTND